MFITKKRYEEELEKARQNGFDEGYKDALKHQYEQERFREIHQRIDRLAERIEKPNTIGFTDGGVTK